MKEVFKPIEGMESRYEVSNLGNIQSINGRKKGKCILKPHIEPLGYKVVNMRSKKDGIINRRLRVHQIVAKAFIKQEDGKIWVNHKDGNKLNNKVDNLEWVTPLENCQHAVKNRLHDLKGEKHPRSKLTKKDILDIYNLRNEGLTHKNIAEIYGISRRHIGDIVNGVCWGWLKDSLSL